MRIVGILIMVIGIPFLGWLSYVELYFLNDVESDFEEQRVKSEQKIRSKISDKKYSICLY